MKCIKMSGNIAHYTGWWEARVPGRPGQRRRRARSPRWRTPHRSGRRTLQTRFRIRVEMNRIRPSRKPGSKFDRMKFIFFVLKKKNLRQA